MNYVSYDIPGMRVPSLLDCVFSWGFLCSCPGLELQEHCPQYPQEMKPLGYGHVRLYIRPTCSPAVSRKVGLTRLSLGTLLVNLSQVIKRTNTPRIP